MLALSAPGWCDLGSKTVLIVCFVPEKDEFDTTRLNGGPLYLPQTTPRRWAALPLLISGGELEKRTVSKPCAEALGYFQVLSQSTFS